ncbi:MAG: mechanosensitive ion channel family protein [Vicinamibacteria bacterium]
MSDVLNQPVMEPVRQLLARVLDFLPNVLLMIAILLVGGAFAWLVRAAVRWTLQIASFDTFCERSGIGEMLSKGGVQQTPSQLAARIVFYLIGLVVFFAALSALNIVAISELVSNFFGYLPHLVVAMLIVMVSYLVARFLHRSVLIAAVNANVRQAGLAARAVQAAILIVGFAVALEQLAIGRGVILAAFSIAFGGIVLALALAFGLAGKDLARDLLERNIQSREDKGPPDDISHI